MSAVSTGFLQPTQRCYIERVLRSLPCWNVRAKLWELDLHPVSSRNVQLYSRPCDSLHPLSTWLLEPNCWWYVKQDMWRMRSGYIRSFERYHVHSVPCWIIQRTTQRLFLHFVWLRNVQPFNGINNGCCLRPLRRRQLRPFHRSVIMPILSIGNLQSKHISCVGVELSALPIWQLQPNIWRNVQRIVSRLLVRNIQSNC